LHAVEGVQCPEKAESKAVAEVGSARRMVEVMEWYTAQADEDPIGRVWEGDKKKIETAGEGDNYIDMAAEVAMSSAANDKQTLQGEGIMEVVRKNTSHYQRVSVQQIEMAMVEFVERMNLMEVGQGRNDLSKSGASRSPQA